MKEEVLVRALSLLSSPLIAKGGDLRALVAEWDESAPTCCSSDLGRFLEAEDERFMLGSPAV
jgi:hypothetical protein